jgi:hypothetical protein
MRKIYLMSAVFLASGFAIAQQNSQMGIKKNVDGIVLKSEASTYSSRSVLWSDDFSDASKWIVDNEVSNKDNWVVTTEGPKGAYSAPMGTITSTTSSNGFALFDSDGLNEFNGSSEQNAWIMFADPINLSANPAVSIKFEQYFRQFYGHTYVEFSTDGGATWDGVEFNTGVAVNASTSNPATVIINVSSYAGGFSQVYFRFRYESEMVQGWGDYALMVDDVELFIPSANELAVSKVYSGDIVNDWDYYSIPTSQVKPMTFLASISNNGSETQNITITYDVKNAAGSVVHNSTSAVTVPIGTTDSLYVFNTTFAPTETGTYTITISLPADANNANNTRTENFEITQHTFGHIHPNDNTSYGFTTDAEFGLGNIYVLNSAQSAYSLKVRFAAQTTPNLEVEISLFEVEQHQQYGNLWEAINILTVTSFIVKQEHIATAGYITIPFSAPVNLEPNKLYMLYIHKYAGSERMRIVSSPKGSDDYSSVLYTAATTGEMYYFKQNNFAPAINLDFNPASINVSELTASSARLFQNQPNPFSKNTTIRYDIVENADVTLTITNVTGKQVMTINEGVKSAGSHAVNISSENLPAGVYFYTLKAGDKQFTKKMVVLE